MNAYLNANWRVFARLLSVMALYLMVKFYPSATLEKETIEAITEVLGLGVLALLPGLRKPRRETDPIPVEETKRCSTDS